MKMMMKTMNKMIMTTRSKFILALTICLAAFSQTYAQKVKVQSAFNYLKYDQLDKAREAIDDAAKHEQTLNDEKTWYYRGNIYQNMYNHEKFSGLVADPLKEAYTSYTKALQLDPNGEFTADIKQKLQAITTDYFNKGARDYNDKNYSTALAAFDNSLEINKILGMAETDSLNLLAYQFSAYAAEQNNQRDIARQNYQKLIDLNYQDPRVYIFLANLHKTDGDTAKALDVVMQGRKNFPDNNSLIIEELNFYLSSGKDTEALDKLQLAIDKEPNNPNLHFALGTINDKLGNSEKAAESYKKAIELKPDYFDAYYNLGAMYFNQGAEMANEANKIPPREVSTFEAAKAKYAAKFQEAKPHLEKALELNPTDENTLKSLVQLYGRTGEKEKFDKVSSTLKTVQ